MHEDNSMVLRFSVLFLTLLAALPASAQVQVRLLYGTVGVLDSERARFYNDIYQRDAGVLNSLDAPFVFHVPTES